MMFAQGNPATSAAATGGRGQHGSSKTGPSKAEKGHPAVVVKATVDKQKIIIGQPIQLMLEATVPAGAPLSWPSLDSLPHFEWVEKGKLDSVIRPNERYYRQYLTVTSFDSGARAIPSLPFLSGANKYLTDSVRIEVGYSKFDPSKDYHDIKDIIDVPNPFAKWIGWIVAAATLLSLGLVIWLIKKRKLLKIAGPAPVASSMLSPYEEAMRQLTEMEQQRPGENGAVKAYYTRMNDIFRMFVLRRLGIASLSETNDELVGQIRRLPVARDGFSALAETLQMSDFVKFAKYRPASAVIDQHLNVIRSSIGLLNELAGPEETTNENNDNLQNIK